MLDGSVAIGIGDSLLVSVIGIVVVFMELILLAIMIVVISKVMQGIAKKEPVAAVATATSVPVAAAPVVAVAPTAPAYIAAPPLTLVDVDAPTAATAMAVVSHQSGIPLNHLAFRSIKGVVALEGISERDAAVVMALVAHQIGTPLDKLCFKSIQYLGEAPVEMADAAAPKKPTAPKKPAAPRKPAAPKKPAAKKTTNE